MPYYDLRCEACQEEHNIKLSIAERVSGEVRCPSCGSDKLLTIYKKVNIVKNLGSSECDACPSSVMGGCAGGSCGTAWR